MDRHITKELKDLDHEIGKIVKNSIHFGKMPLNHTQVHIIGYLLKNADKKICQKQIEEEIHLKKASITGSLDSLQDKGLIQRVTCKDDKRKKYIKLTDIVMKEKKEIENKFREIDKKLVKNLSKEEINSFFLIVDKMKKNLEN